MKTRTLGKLEQQVMEIVWENKNWSVRDVLIKLQQKRFIAYTTVSTILQRLFAKGLLERKPNRNGYLYSAKISKEKYIKNLTHTFVDMLLKSFGEIAVSSFAQGIESLPRERKKYLLKILSEHEK